MSFRGPRLRRSGILAVLLTSPVSMANAQVQDSGALPQFLDDQRLRHLESSVVPSEAERRRQAEDEVKRRADDVRRATEQKMRQDEAAAADWKLAKKVRRETQAQRTDDPASPASPVAGQVAKPALVYAGAAITARPVLTAPGEGKPAQACPAPRIVTKSLAGGRMGLTVEHTCQASRSFVVRYGGYELHRVLNAEGRAELEIDLFLGRDTPLGVTLADGSQHGVTIETADLERVTKIAVIWQGPLNLDLHALEYAAQRGEAGHVWAAAPSNANAAAERSRTNDKGAGFMSSADRGHAEGHSIEVYTFWNGAGSGAGNVSLALDYESRGSVPSEHYCGAGGLAQVPFEVVVRSADGRIGREKGLISAAACGEALAEPARYNRDALPELRFN